MAAATFPAGAAAHWTCAADFSCLFNTHDLIWQGFCVKFPQGPQAPAAAQLAQPAPTCLLPVMPRNSHLGFPCFHSFKNEHRRHLVFLHSFECCCKSILGKSFGSLPARASPMAKLNVTSAAVLRLGLD